MRAAEMKKRPDFPLMRQTDVQSIYHMQMPRWLFSDPHYADMSLDAKVAYTFLLNRFQLSRRNGWTNEQGEVFVIFPRKALAKELRICEKRVTAAFQTLAKRNLIWEKRCGRGDANQIYLAHVQPQDDPEYTSAPFVPEEHFDDSRTANSADLMDEEPICGAVSVPQEPQKRPFKNRQSCGSLIGNCRNIKLTRLGIGEESFLFGCMEGEPVTFISKNAYFQPKVNVFITKSA